MPPWLAVEGVVAGRGEPFLRRRPDVLAAAVRSFVVSGLGTPAFIASRSFCFDGQVDHGLQVGTREAVGLLGQVLEVDVLPPACRAEDAQDGGAGRPRRAAARTGCGRTGPGRRKAESRCHGALVAARISTPSFEASTPSSSERNWLMSCRPALCRMSARLRAQGVDLVEEQHARRVLAGLLEQSRAGCARSGRSTCRARR